MNENEDKSHKYTYISNLETDLQFK